MLNAHDIADEIVNPNGYADDDAESDRRAEERDRVESIIAEHIANSTTTLTDREYAEIIGSLQIVRDNARAQGREPVDVVSALAKITQGCTPSTNGMTFSLNGPVTA